MTLMVSRWETERANALTANVQQLRQKVRDLDHEADELFDKVEAHEKEKKSRDWHIFLYKDAIETLKEWPRGKPAGYKPPEVLREQARNLYLTRPPARA